MKRTLIFIVVGLSSLVVSGQAVHNLDFEVVENGTAKSWKNFGKGKYILKLDSDISQQGNNSGYVEFIDGTPGFKAWAYDISAVYKGDKIKLTGYIKTENVTDGYAGLWMRIDPSVAFDNMSSRGIKGTTDWTKYEIELALKFARAQKIVVGGLLVGKGKMWLDNLQVTIDGKALNKVPLKELSKVEKDTTFKNGSKIEAIELNEQTIQDLKQLGLIWGFLKYYHPNIAKGDYNWDFELFRILPKIIKSKNTDERDEYLVQWIQNLGEYSFSENVKKEKQDIKTKADLKWIKQLDYSKSLKKELINIEKAKRSGVNYYVSLAANVQNPNFQNEAVYPEMKYPDAGYRLLALYRYWNIIQYYFPYKNLIEEDWKDVLVEFIPKFVNAKNELEYKLAVLELIARVHDTHANIWGWDMALNRYWGMNLPAIELNFVENKAVVTGYYDEELGKKTGLIKGDNIVKINNKTIDDIIKERLKYTPASNYPRQLRDLSTKILRTNDTLLNLEFIRNGQTQAKSIEVYNLKKINIYKKYQQKDSCFKFINKDIAYLYLGAIKNSYLPNIFEKIKDTKGLIIDLRCYPSDFVVFTLSQYLLPEKMPFVRFTGASLTNAGRFTFSDCLEVGRENKDYYKGKVIILVNETTLSQAEYTAMALRVSPKATVVGSTTAGADGNVSPFYLPGKIKTMISGIGVYYPNKQETQRIGIVPDIKVLPTIKGIVAGKDEVLEKAIELIEGK